jgi:cytidylate kinase
MRSLGNTASREQRAHRQVDQPIKIIEEKRAALMAENIKPDTPRNRGDYEARHVTPVTPAEDARTILLNKVSWGAVFAGVVVALVTQLILNMIGIGIGAATPDPGTR